MLKNYHYTLIIFTALGFTGFILWREFICTKCFASEVTQETVQTLGKQTNQGPQVGSPAPNFVLENLVGEQTSLADFVGRNVLLIFWDINCGWCERERPDLIRLTEEQGGKIEIVALAPDSKETLSQYAKEKGINFTLLVDPARKTAIKYLALGTPSHFLIDKQGTVAAVKPGYADYNYLLMLAKSVEQ